MIAKLFTVFFLLISMLFGSTAYCQAPKDNNFISSVHRFKGNVEIIGVVPVAGKFLCLEESGNLFYIDPASSKIDTSINKFSKNFYFQQIKIVSDTVVANNRDSSYFLDRNAKGWRVYKIKNHLYLGNLIFQDSDYFISGTCSGEWGGTIYFTDKKTLKTYEGGCQCVLDVIKQKGYYNITTSLDHMAGFMSIFNVKEPRKLKRYHPPQPIEKGHPIKLRPVGSNESNSTKGMIKIVDTIGSTCDGSFRIKKSIFYIVERSSYKNPKGVWLDSIKNNKLVQMDNLTNWGITGEGYQNFSYNDIIITPFDNKNFSGFICIIKDKVDLYIFDRLNK